MRVTATNKIWLIPPTRAIWIPANMLHGISMQRDVVLRTLYIEVPEAAFPMESPHTLEVAPLLRELILHTLDIGTLTPERADHIRLSGLLIDLILGARHEDLMLPLPHDERALKVAHQWHTTPHDNTEIMVLAAQAGVSLRSLQRLFVRETGMSPEAWRRKARIIESAGLLANGSQVTTTAFAVGYESVAAFSLAFREHFGTSPGRYRIGYRRREHQID